MASLTLDIAPENPVRVRQVILSLDHTELVRNNVIPDLTQFIPTIPTKRYPSWVYRLKRAGYDNIYSQFGLFMEELVVSAIQEISFSYLEAWQRCGSIPIDEADLDRSTRYFLSIQRKFSQMFQSHTSDVRYNYELNYKSIQGHPDLFRSGNIINDSDKDNFTCTPGWILDVKTTGNFSKMMESSLLQILAYATIARACQHPVNHIGILLPLQTQILWFDISKWDSSVFQKVLLRESKLTQQDMVIYNPERFMLELTKISNFPDQIVFAPNIIGTLGAYIESPILGSHIRKHSPFPLRIPFQIFLGSNQGEFFITESEIDELKTRCAPGCQLFVHAPYIINLCSSKAWPCERLHHELKSTLRLGGRGVVVHVGKYTTQGYSTGLNKMIESIERVLPSASSECPLLIETPAGEGTELCTSMEQLQDLYAHFQTTKYDLVRNHLKICIDTCHVFAAGYDPVHYLNSWLQKYPDSVALVHFNDSKEPRGSRKDRHYPAGLGYIGFPRLWQVHEICRKNNIPMVRE